MHNLTQNIFKSFKFARTEYLFVQLNNYKIQLRNKQIKKNIYIYILNYILSTVEIYQKKKLRIRN